LLATVLGAGRLGKAMPTGCNRSIDKRTGCGFADRAVGDYWQNLHPGQS